MVELCWYSDAEMEERVVDERFHQSLPFDKRLLNGDAVTMLPSLLCNRVGCALRICLNVQLHIRKAISHAQRTLCSLLCSGVLLNMEVGIRKRAWHTCIRYTLLIYDHWGEYTLSKKPGGWCTAYTANTPLQCDRWSSSVVVCQSVCNNGWMACSSFVVKTLTDQRMYM